MNVDALLVAILAGLIVLLIRLVFQSFVLDCTKAAITGFVWLYTLVPVGVNARRAHRELASSLIAIEDQRLKEQGLGPEARALRLLANQVFPGLLETALWIAEELWARFGPASREAGLTASASEVSVFTPSRDVVKLPKGSTPVDYAYRIHTEIGDAFADALVNGRRAEPGYQLRDGDVVQIVTATSGHGPSPEWLGLVATSRARSKIRRWLRYHPSVEIVGFGAKMVTDAARRRTAGRFVELDEVAIQRLAAIYGFVSADELFVAVAIGDIPPDDVVDDQFDPGLAARTSRIYVGAVVVIDGIRQLVLAQVGKCRPKGDEPAIYLVSHGKATLHRHDCGTVAATKYGRKYAVVSWDVAANMRVVHLDVSIRETSEAVNAIQRACARYGAFAAVWKKVSVAAGWSRIRIAMRIASSAQLSCVIGALERLTGVSAVDEVDLDIYRGLTLRDHEDGQPTTRESRIGRYVE